MKKILLALLAFCSGVILTSSYNRINTSYVTCQYYEGGFESVLYIPDFKIGFFEEENSYLFDVTINTNEFIDYSGYDNQSMFVSLSFDGKIPYSISQSDHNVIEIPIENGKLPETLSFQIDSKNNFFTNDNLEILNQFLAEDSDRLLVSLNIYSPDGIIEQVANTYIYK